jgi:hypothetical protein
LPAIKEPLANARGSYQSANPYDQKSRDQTSRDQTSRYRPHGAFGCIIAEAGFLMNDPLRPAGFLQTAFTQAEGELRSAALFRRESVTGTFAGSELPLGGAGDGRRMRYRIQHTYPTIQGSKTIQSP